MNTQDVVTMAWKVYGVSGHRMRESFNDSYRYDFSKSLSKVCGRESVRIIEVENYDKTGTHDYSIVRITRNTLNECEKEFWGQISDGIFENTRVGKIERIG